MTKTLSDLVKASPLTEKEKQLFALEYIANEIKILRLYPGIIDRINIRVEIPSELLNLLDMIIEKSLSEVTNVLEKHHKVTGQHYKEFIKWWIEILVKEIITDEYLMILNVKRFAQTQSFIEGKYLRYEILNEKLEFIDQPCQSLIDNCVDTFRPLIFAYKEKNSEWLSVYMQKNQELIKATIAEEAKQKQIDSNPLVYEALQFYRDCVRVHKKATITGLSKYLKMPRSTLVDNLGPKLHLKIKQLYKTKLISKN